MIRNRRAVVAVVLGFIGLGAGRAHATLMGPLVPTHPGAALSLVGFQGPIPTEASPLRGEARLAKMRREGRLPDTFTRGACRYDLAGDPAVAYYVKTCKRQ